MSKAVKPLNISILIRGSRYLLLFSGITYGILRQSGLKVYEATAGVKRHHMFEEEKKRKKAEEINKTKDELKNVTIGLNIPEIPPGWENDADL